MNRKINTFTNKETKRICISQNKSETLSFQHSQQDFSKHRGAVTKRVQKFFLPCFEIGDKLPLMQDSRRLRCKFMHERKEKRGEEKERTGKKRPRKYFRARNLFISQKWNLAFTARKALILCFLLRINVFPILVIQNLRLFVTKNLLITITLVTNFPAVIRRISAACSFAIFHEGKKAAGWFRLYAC